MAEKAQHRRQAIDGGHQLGRRAPFRRGKGGAHVEQVTQHGELQMRRPLGHDAVMQDVALHELGEPRQRLLEALLEALAVAQEGEIREDQRLQRGNRLVPDQAGAHRPPEMGALAGEREHEARGEARIGSGRQPVVMADPRNDALGQHVAPPAHRRPTAFMVGPVVDQAGGERRSGRIAAVAQVTQPAKAVQRIEPEGSRPGPPPRRIFGVRHHRARAAARQKLTGNQALACGRITRPAVGGHGEKAARRAIAQCQGIEARSQQPAAEAMAFAARRLGRAGGDGARRAGAGHQRLTRATHV